MMWRPRVVQVETPINRAAFTNSRSRSDFVMFFTTCAATIQPKAAKIRISSVQETFASNGETTSST